MMVKEVTNSQMPSGGSRYTCVCRISYRILFWEGGAKVPC